MEKKFLLYLLYMTLVELREYAYENNDKKTFWMCDLLHNVPMSLETEHDTANAYKELQEKVASLGMEKWFENRTNEFRSKNNLNLKGESGDMVE
jgi:hypothetical protein